MDLAAEAAVRGLQDVLAFHGQVSYGRALREMVEADVLLLMDSPGRTIGVPAKLYEYLGAGRPILALGERGGDLERVLFESGAPHRIAPPGDTAGITTALAELIAEARGGAGFDSSHDPHRFSRESITGRLVEMLETACLPSRHAAFVAEGVTS